MVALVMLTVYKSLKDLEIRLAASKQDDWKFSEQLVEEVSELVNNAQSTVVLLDSFMRRFKKVLPEHLEWLSQVAKAADPHSSTPIRTTPSMPADHGSSEQEDLADDSFDHLAGIIAGKEKSRGKWATAAQEYMWPICLHTVGLRVAAGFDPEKKDAVIGNSNVDTGSGRLAVILDRAVDES